MGSDERAWRFSSTWAVAALHSSDDREVFGVDDDVRGGSCVSTFGLGV